MPIWDFAPVKRPNRFKSFELVRPRLFKCQNAGGWTYTDIMDRELPLDESIVRELLAEQFPDLAVAAARYLHAGWDSTAWLINGQWVFRFPKREERREWVDSELGVLDLLGRRDLSVSVPVPEYVGQASRRFPCRFMGYRLIAGTTGDRLSPNQVDQKESAARLGELLTVVHSIDPCTADARIQTYDFPLDGVLAETIAMRETVLLRLPIELQTVCRPYLDGTCAVPMQAAALRCLVHGDLVDEHVVLDDCGRVSGVIDWGDAGLSDPGHDFGGLWAWLGAEFVRDVLSHYGHPWNEAFVEQIAFRARCAALSAYGWSLLGKATCSADRLPLVYTAFGVAAPH